MLHSKVTAGWKDSYGLHGKAAIVLLSCVLCPTVVHLAFGFKFVSGCAFWWTAVWPFHYRKLVVIQLVCTAQQKRKMIPPKKWLEVNETTSYERPCDFIELIVVWNERDKAVGSHSCNVGAGSIECCTSLSTMQLEIVSYSLCLLPWSKFVHSFCCCPSWFQGLVLGCRPLPQVLNDGEVQGSFWPHKDVSMLWTVPSCIFCTWMHYLVGTLSEDAVLPADVESLWCIVLPSMSAEAWQEISPPLYLQDLYLSLHTSLLYIPKSLILKVLIQLNTTTPAIWQIPNPQPPSSYTLPAIS